VFPRIHPVDILDDEHISQVYKTCLLPSEFTCRFTCKGLKNFIDILNAVEH